MTFFATLLFFILMLIILYRYYKKIKLNIANGKPAFEADEILSKEKTFKDYSCMTIFYIGLLYFPLSIFIPVSDYLLLIMLLPILFCAKSLDKFR